MSDLATSPGRSDMDTYLSPMTCRLVERAIRGGWEVKDEWKAVLPTVAARIVADEKRPEKHRLRAMQLLMQMDALNLDALGKAAENYRKDRGDEPTAQVKVTVYAKEAPVEDV